LFIANENEAEVLFVGFEGPLEIVVSGAMVSTIQDTLGGAVSTAPEGPVAVTTSVCAPSERPVIDTDAPV
jgi:hypothetical protein